MAHRRYREALFFASAMKVDFCLVMASASFFTSLCMPFGTERPRRIQFHVIPEFLQLAHSGITGSGCGHQENFQLGLCRTHGTVNGAIIAASPLRTDLLRPLIPFGRWMTSARRVHQHDRRGVGELPKA